MVTAVAAENTDLQTQNTEVNGRVLKLEKSDTIRAEQSIRDRADSIWGVALAEAGIRTDVHGKIKKQISHSAFVTDGVLDETAFTAAIKTELEDWTGFVAEGGEQIIGTGNLLDEPAPKVDDAKDDEVANRLFDFVGGGVPNTSHLAT